MRTSLSPAGTQPIRILEAMSIGLNRKSNSPTLGDRLSRTLSTAWNWVVCNCTPRKIFRAIFCEKVSMAVGAILVVVMWWHNITIDDNIAAGEAVAADCLYAMPWGLVWAIRATISSIKEGGEL